MSVATLRASYSFAAPVLKRFNAVVPAGERSKVVERLVEQITCTREQEYERIAQEFESHPDFAQARATVKAFAVLGTDAIHEYQ